MLFKGKCKQCKVKFTRVLYGKREQDFCSRSCSSRAQALKQHIFMKKVASSGKIVGMYGRPRTRSYKKKHSKDMRTLWKTGIYRKNWRDSRRQNTDTRNYKKSWLVAETRKARLAGKLTSWTRLERTVAAVFRQLKLQYISQPVLKTSSVPDFLLPDFGRVVECDGIRWHSSLVARRKDARNTKRYQRLGFKVSRLSEEFIKNETRLFTHLKRLCVPTN